MARVYASSPVEQAGTHSRTTSWRSWLATSGVMTSSTSAFHTSGSRKKLVTRISSSRNSSERSSSLAASNVR